MGERIFVAGHRGMLGAAIVRALEFKGKEDIIVATRSELDLTEQIEVRKFFSDQRPDVVYLAAAKVGGIYANDTYPADFLYDNLIIEANVIHSAFQSGVRRLLFLGSSCIYPKLSNQPIRESELLTGPLEPTNEPYALAKIAGIKLCESYNRQYSESHGIDFRCLMPTNLYGPGDNYHIENSHVIPALIRRFHEAKVTNSDSVTVWGSGNPRREFLYVEDAAAACVHLMDVDKELFNGCVSPRVSHVNLGSGLDISIKGLVNMICDVVGYGGRVHWDLNIPDGTPQKLMNSSVMRSLGWVPKVDLSEGLQMTYRDFLKNIEFYT